MNLRKCFFLLGLFGQFGLLGMSSFNCEAHIRYQAKLVPQSEQILYAPFAGRVEVLWVQPGQDVTQGGAILKLSTEDGETKWVEWQQDMLRLEQKIAGFEMNNQNLEWVKLSNQHKKSQMEMDRSFKRFQDSLKLEQKGIISREEFERDSKSYQDAKLHFEEMQIALNQFKSERNPTLKQMLLKQHALLKKRQAAMDKALKQSTLQAPIAGKIKRTSKNSDNIIRVGSSVQSGQPLFIIEPQSNPMVEFKLTEYELSHINLGQELIVQASPKEDLPLKAKVIAIESGEAEAHQPMPFKVKLELLDGQTLPPELRIGMSVSVDIG